MKETKVYVDELPKNCWDCFCQDSENGRCKILGKYTDYVPKDCSLHDIRDHDRELVKKVLEKAKSLITKYDLLKDYNSCAGYYMLDKIIDQIQKEYDK